MGVKREKRDEQREEERGKNRLKVGKKSLSLRPAAFHSWSKHTDVALRVCSPSRILGEDTKPAPAQLSNSCTAQGLPSESRADGRTGGGTDGQQREPQAEQSADASSGDPTSPAPSRRPSRGSQSSGQGLGGSRGGLLLPPAAHTSRDGGHKPLECQEIEPPREAPPPGTALLEPGEGKGKGRERKGRKP